MFCLFLDQTFVTEVPVISSLIRFSIFNTSFGFISSEFRFSCTFTSEGYQRHLNAN